MLAFLKKHRVEIGLLAVFLAYVGYNVSSGSCGACNAGIALLGLDAETPAETSQPAATTDKMTAAAEAEPSAPTP